MQAAGDTPDGDAERITETLYGELHRLALAQFRRHGAAHTLQPTALLNEAWMRIERGSPHVAHDREHYLSLAARVMRQVLVDHARKGAAAKRGGAWRKLTLTDTVVGTAEGVDLLGMDDALRELAELDPDRAQLVELRFFGGLTEDEAAQVLGVSRSDVQRKWVLARAWLARQLRSADDDGSAS